MSKLYEQWSRLKPKEKLYIATHPQHAKIIKDSQSKAFNETQKRFGRNGRNDKSDAFRHCYWSALLARDIGYFNALKFTNAHEDYEGNPSDEKLMDLHNNSIGLKIGSQLVYLAPGLGSIFAKNKELSDQCHEALILGKLITSPSAAKNKKVY